MMYKTINPRPRYEFFIREKLHNGIQNNEGSYWSGIVLIEKEEYQGKFNHETN